MLLILSFNATAAYKSLKSSQQVPYRITNEQLELVSWINENTPEKAVIGDIGTITLPKVKWLRQLSHRFVQQAKEGVTINYLIIDYSDFYYLNAQNEINQLRQIEASINATPIYNKNNIKVYQIG